MSHEQVLEKIGIYLAPLKIWGDDIDVKVDEIYASIPESVLKELPQDKHEAVLEFLPTWLKTNNGEGGTPNHTPSGEQGNKPAAPSAINTAQAKAIKKVIQEGRALKEMRTAKTTISKLVIDKPDPKGYLDPKQTVVPTCKAEKLAEYEKLLDRTDEKNVAAFQQVKDAVLNGTALPIHISDPQNKVIGFDITTPSDDAGQETMVNDLKTYDEMLGFVASKTIGVIPNTQDGIGVVLRWNTPKQNKSGKWSAGAPTLNIAGKKKAIERADGHIIASKIVKNGGKVVTKPGKLRISLSFRIDTGEVRTNKEKIYRTVRLSGDAQVPKFERINEEFNKKFGSGERDRDIVNIPVGKDAEKVEDAMIQSMAFFCNGSAASRYGVTNVQETILKELDGNAANADDMEL